MTIVKFADVELFPDEIEALASVLASGNFINGKEVAEFEQLFAEAVGVEFCAGMGSGSAALEGAIEALVEEKNIPRSERHHYGIIVPALTFFATASAVAHAGFVPIYVDVDQHGLINYEQAHDMLMGYGDKCLGMIPVHMYGQVTEIPPEFTFNADIFVLEDACQAFGAYTKLQGDMAAFSFYPAKNLGAAGDAGAVVSNDYNYAIYAKAWANYGDMPATKYNHAILGTNNRLDTVQAAILAAKLKSEMRASAQEYRVNIAKEYIRQGVETILNLDLPNSFHLFPIMVAGPLKDEFRKFMASNNVQIGNHYPYTLPKVVEGWMMANGYPQAELIASNVITLPVGPHMSFVETEIVTGLLKEYREYEDTQTKKLIQLIEGENYE